MDKTGALVLFARSAWVPNGETVLGHKKILNGRHVSVQIGMTKRLWMLSKRAADHGRTETTPTPVFDLPTQRLPSMSTLICSENPRPTRSLPYKWVFLQG